MMSQLDLADFDCGRTKSKQRNASREFSAWPMIICHIGRFPSSTRCVCRVLSCARLTFVRLPLNRNPAQVAKQLCASANREKEQTTWPLSQQCFATSARAFHLHHSPLSPEDSFRCDRSHDLDPVYLDHLGSRQHHITVRTPRRSLSPYDQRVHLGSDLGFQSRYRCIRTTISAPYGLNWSNTYTSQFALRHRLNFLLSSIATTNTVVVNCYIDFTQLRLELA